MIFWDSLAFSMIQWMLAIWSLLPLPFLKQAWNLDFTVHALLKPGLENFEHYFTSMWDECNQETPGVTGKFGLGMQNEAGQRLIEFYQENALVIANSLLQKTREDPTHGHHHDQTDCILCSQRWRSSVQSAKTRLRAKCGSDHEFLIEKFRLKLKKVEKTSRPFRYDLNKIPYDYTVEVRNRFRG